VKRLLQLLLAQSWTKLTRIFTPPPQVKKQVGLQQRLDISFRYHYFRLLILSDASSIRGKVVFLCTSAARDESGSFECICDDVWFIRGSGALLRLFSF